MNKTVRFFKNWNNKLDCDYFTTIRLYTPEKSEYYFGNMNNTFTVLLKGTTYCKAKLISMQEKSLFDIALGNHFIFYLDAGLNQKEFYLLMEKFYKNKKEWKGYNTCCLILLFKREK